MRNRLLTLVALLVAVLAAAVLSACGSDDTSSGGSGGDKVQFDLKKAADATKAKGSAEMSLKVGGKSGDQSGDLVVTGKADFENGKLDAQMDLASLLAAANVPAQGEQVVRVLIDGKKAWIKIPNVQGAEILGGKEWVSLDIDAAIDEFGLKEQAEKAESQQIDPIEMEKVGTETLNGEEVTRLKATATLRDLIEGLPEDQRKQALAQIEKQKDGEKALDTAVPVEVWADSSNAIHRLTAKISDDKTDIAVDLTLKNFGTEVAIDAPADDEVFDATALLLQAADQFGSSLGGGKTP